MPGAPLLPQPLEHLQVAALRRRPDSGLVQGAAFSPEPLQDVQMAAPCRLQTGPRVPRAALGSEPPQSLQVSLGGRSAAAPGVPGAALVLEPPKNLQVPPHGRSAEGGLVPGAPFSLDQPHEHLKVAVQGSDAARHRTQRAPFGSQPLQHRQVAALSCCTGGLPAHGIQALGRQPLEHLQVAPGGGSSADPCIEAAALLHRHLKQPDAAAYLCSPHPCRPAEQPRMHPIRPPDFSDSAVQAAVDLGQDASPRRRGGRHNAPDNLLGEPSPHGVVGDVPLVYASEGQCSLVARRLGVGSAAGSWKPSCGEDDTL
mmetsp:Transcript_12470/g.35025  ORF Transcript_12470/g.35025 Transcript_12470/m.35025 type:complete len:313 (+) Transcript_12470:489-1427(+)